MKMFRIQYDGYRNKRTSIVLGVFRSRCSFISMCVKSKKKQMKIKK